MKPIDSIGVFFILLATLLSGCTATPPSASSQTPEHAPRQVTPEPQQNAAIQRFVIRSDTQYPRTKDSSEDKPESARLIEAQDAAINAYRDSKGLRIFTPVFLNGDITEFSHGWQWDYMKPRLQAMAPVYWGLGNHEYDNNVDDCLNNGCARDAVLNLIEHAGKSTVDAFDEREEGSGDPFHQDYIGSMSYSKTIGDFMFIQLNNHFSYTRKWTSHHNAERKTFIIESSLDWLEGQLNSANARRKHVIINMHRPPTDSTYGSEADHARFEKLVNDQQVVAIFHGHTHDAGRRSDLGKVPVFDSGAAFMETFLAAEYAARTGELKVQLAQGNQLGPIIGVAHALYPGPVPQPRVTSVTSGTLAFEFNQPSNYKQRPFDYFEISFNGGAFQRVDASNKISFRDLRPATDYPYVVRATDTLGISATENYSGVARTIPYTKQPTKLCMRTLSGQRLSAHWEPAEPGYWPMPFYFEVAYLQKNGNTYQTLQDGGDYSQSYSFTLPTPAPPADVLRTLDLAVRYVAGLGMGAGPWTKLPMIKMWDDFENFYCK
ncbi:metallophosphoesterase [Pseudomonas xanthosomatis]|uniref:metallophosphoesterase n=1 Tax=Pseudomonas xanthosomatis TaxID=2842356 RepID=UPI003515A8F4